MGDMADFIFDSNINYVDEEMLADNEEALLSEQECTIGCMINTQVGGHHRYCGCHCHIPFTDSTPATDDDTTAAYHGQERAV